MTDKVIIENHGLIRVVYLNRPQVRNSVDGETAVGLGEAIEAFAVDTQASLLIVRPTLASGELTAGVARFAAGARDSSPSPPR